MSLKIGRRINVRQWNVLHVTELVIKLVEQISADEDINDMVDGEILFEWEPGEPILLQPDYEEVTPSLNHAVNEEPKGNSGHAVILFGE